MNSATPSTKLKSLYIARFLLETAGVFLLVSSALAAFLAYDGNVRHVEGRLLVGACFLLLTGTGLLLPQIWAKLVASLSLIAAGAWTFYIDAFRWHNLRFDLLFLLPLLLTLWLWKGYNDLNLRRLPGMAKSRITEEQSA